MEAARSALERTAPGPAALAALLPQAVALDLGALWAARPGQQRPPAPPWSRPGPALVAQGRLGITALVAAASAPPPPGGGAGTPLASPHSGSW